MSVLIISKYDQRRIDEAIARASANPVRWETMKDIVVEDDRPDLPLADRPAGFERPASEHLMFGNVRVAYSHEEQPAGICRHISASVRRPGKLPHPEVVRTLCEAFHFDNFPPVAGRIWTEEFEPGHRAINVVEVIGAVAPAGHA